MLEGWFDGCCEPTNPGGHAAWGALLKLNSKVVWESSGYCGHGPGMSNNVAEYSGIGAVLEKALDFDGLLTIRGDSKLVIHQLAGEWRINGGLYIPYYQRAQELLDKNRKFRQGNVALYWISRDENGECDRLSKRELFDRNVTFRIQPEKPQANKLRRSG